MRDRFGFETWMDFDAELWQRLIADAETQERSGLLAPILGSDHNPQVIEQAQVNARLSGVDSWVKFETRELADIEPPTDAGVIFCNPPYGERLGNDRQLGEFYQLLGSVLKQRFKGWVAYVLSGNKKLSQTIGLRSSKRFSVYNGSISCQLMKYELF